MLTKTQLQQEVQNLETQLQEFREQLNSHNGVTIETASVGDTLEDGSIVIKRENGLALLVAPKTTQVETTWSKDFPEMFQELKELGFNSSQWFVPTIEQLKLAHQTIPDEFSSTGGWSSTEFNTNFACVVDFTLGLAGFNVKINTLSVRAFRCVTY